jgi:hypothetical protein
MGWPATSPMVAKVRLAAMAVADDLPYCNPRAMSPIMTVAGGRARAENVDPMTSIQ